MTDATGPSGGPDLRAELDFAVELAWRAGRLTLAHFQTGVAVEAKPDDTPVTVADRAAEELARELIRGRFPDDGIVGEEFGTEGEGAERRWILDPIDGTRSFVRGVPLYGVMVALEAGGEAVLGVLHFPPLEETVYAARGLGCWWNGRRARVSGIDRLEAALLLHTDHERLFDGRHAEVWERLRRSAGMTRTWGDCYGFALVATGRAEVMLEPDLALWDIAPLQPIVEEAGGAFTDWKGERTHLGGDCIATNAALADEVRAILRGDNASTGGNSRSTAGGSTDGASGPLGGGNAGGDKTT